MKLYDKCYQILFKCKRVGKSKGHMLRWNTHIIRVQLRQLSWIIQMVQQDEKKMNLKIFYMKLICFWLKSVCKEKFLRVGHGRREWSRSSARWKISNSFPSVVQTQNASFLRAKVKGYARPFNEPSNQYRFVLTDTKHTDMTLLSWILRSVL